MERGWDTIHGVAKSRTQMNNTFIVKGVHFSLSTDLASISHILKCLIYYIFTKFEIKFPLFQFSSVTQSCLTLCDPMDCSMPGLPASPWPAPGVYSNSCPSSQLCHPTISLSVVPFSSRLQSFPASGSFPMSQFISGGQSIGPSVSASVLPMNSQHSFPLGLIGLISLQSNTTVQKLQGVAPLKKCLQSWGQAPNTPRKMGSKITG